MVLTDLQGKGHERKEASLLKAFLVTFVATKVTGPPAAKSGYTSCMYMLRFVPHKNYFIPYNDVDFVLLFYPCSLI